MNAEICYLIYGSNPSYPLQFHFSLLTLLDQAHQENISLKVILYTDNPAAFLQFPVETRSISPEKWLSWVQPSGYIHRSKACVVAEFLKKSTQPSLFLDTDTYFKGSLRAVLTPISTTSAVLHECEGSLNQQFPLLFTAYQDILPYGAEMWNSGVIGLLPEHAVLLDEALVLMDLLWKKEPCLQAEQLALGEVLKKQVAIQAACEDIEHYWGYRLPFALKQMRSFFKRHEGKSFDELIPLSRTLQPCPPPIPEQLHSEAYGLGKHYHWSKLHHDGMLLLRMASPSLSREVDERFFWRQGALSWLKRDLHESKDEDKQLRWRLFASDKSLQELVEESFPDDLTDAEIANWQSFGEEIEAFLHVPLD